MAANETARREQGTESPRSELTAAVLTIGNEILSGKVTDLNLTYLTRELRDLGVPLVLALIVPDTETAIAEAVRYASARADFVLSTGGVGPTHDDITVASIAKGFGKKLVRSEKLERAVRAYYGGRVNDDVLRMADVPEGSELIEEAGLSFPLLRVENVYVFPGDPASLRRKFAAWKERWRQSPFALRKLYLDADESEIAAALRAVEAAHPVAIGSYPRYDGGAEWRVLITIEAKDPQAVRAAERDLLTRLGPGQLVRADG